jgi:hypothetical protein
MLLNRATQRHSWWLVLYLPWLILVCTLLDQLVADCWLYTNWLLEWHQIKAWVFFVFKSVLYKCWEHVLSHFWSYFKVLNNFRVHDLISVQCDHIWTCLLTGIDNQFLLDKTEKGFEVLQKLFVSVQQQRILDVPTWHLCLMQRDWCFLVSSMTFSSPGLEISLTSFSFVDHRDP